MKHMTNHIAPQDAAEFKLVVHDSERRRGRSLAPAQAGGCCSTQVLFDMAIVVCGAATVVMAVPAAVTAGVALRRRAKRKALDEKGWGDNVKNEKLKAFDEEDHAAQDQAQPKSEQSEFKARDRAREMKCIYHSCPECKEVIESGSAIAGFTTRCPHCGADKVLVPEQDAHK